MIQVKRQAGCAAAQFRPGMSTDPACLQAQRLP